MYLEFKGYLTSGSHIIMDSRNNLYALIGNVLYRYIEIFIYLSINYDHRYTGLPTKNVTSDTFVYYIIFTNMSQLKTQFKVSI